MIKNMPFIRKVQYYIQYYTVYVVTGIVILSVLGILIVHFVKKPKDTALYVVVFNQLWSEESKKTLEKTFISEAGIGDEAEVYIDDSFILNQNGLEKLEVYLSNQRVDVIIASKEDFETLAGYGFLLDLEQVSGISKECRKKTIKVRGYRDNDEISFEDNETGKGEALFYGMELPENPWCFLEKQKDDEVVVSIAAGTENEENAVSFMEILERCTDKN